jgi:tRNA-modifying protein YgfZ
VLFDFLVEREVDFPPEPGMIGRLRDPDWQKKQHLTPTGDYLIDVEAARADALVKRLSLYRLRRQISIAVDPTLCAVWPEGHHDGWPDPRTNMEISAPWLGYRYIAKRQPDMIDGSDAYRAHRLSLGVTEGVAELGDGETLWLECNSAELNGVSFSKGCYVGQENTARMNWRSTVNRRLCVVPLAEADPKRQRVAYPELGLSVEHRRVEDIPTAAWRDWMGER